MCRQRFGQGLRRAGTCQCARDRSCQAQIILKVVAHFVQNRAQRPGIDQAVIGKLNQGEWIHLPPSRRIRMRRVMVEGKTPCACR